MRRIPAFGMSLFARPVLLIVVAIVAVAGVAGGFFAREPIERYFFLKAARERTGIQSLEIARVDRDGPDFVLSAVHAQTADGAVTLDVPVARVRAEGNTYRIALGSPSLKFAPTAYADADRAAFRDAFVKGDAATNAAIAIDNGTLSVAPPFGMTPLAADKIAGTLTVRAAQALFDGSLVLEAGGKTYPILGKPRSDPSGTAQGWTAASIPVDAFAPFVDASALAKPVSGMLTGLDVSDGPAFRATARLQDVRVEIGTSALEHVKGDLLAVGDGIGSPDLEGTIGGQRFTFAGEVHDLRSHYRWLSHGTNEMRALAKLAVRIAAEPNLHGDVRLETTAPGLIFGQYEMQGDHGPVAISLLSADPTEPTLRFDTAIASDRVISGGERTSAMGLRTGAVAGVNGDYFDIGRTYQPQGMLMRAGALVRGPTDRAVLAIDKNNHVTFGEFAMAGSLRTPRGVFPITEFNSWPPGQTAVITPAYGATLGPADATFVRLEQVEGDHYRVAGVTPGVGTTPVTFGVAIGRLAKTPLPKVGDAVQLDYATNPPLRDAVAAIGGGPILVRNGEGYEDPHAPAADERDYRWPVIALAHTKDERLELVAVDGRHPERSVGMTRPEFAELLMRLGATDAMALDSGGSVTLVSRAPGDKNVTVRNVPSDDSAERWVSDALFIYSSAPLPSIVAPGAATTPVPEARPTP